MRIQKIPLKKDIIKPIQGRIICFDITCFIYCVQSTSSGEVLLALNFAGEVF